MKILVIEDSPANVKSARETLAGHGHKVTICQDIQSAYDTLRGKEEFDAVLTDLFLPLGAFEGTMDTRKYRRPDGDLPAGLVFAIKAVNRGIRTVIVTDSHHHADWICSLLDLVGTVDPQWNRGDANQKVSYIEARGAYVEDISDFDHPIKDWLAAMKQSGLFPELEKE